MNYMYDAAMAKIKLAVGDIAIARVAHMTQIIDWVIRRGFTVTDAASMRSAYHGLGSKMHRHDMTFRVVLTEMGRDAMDPPISGTHMKVATYEEVPAYQLGPVFENIRRDVLKIREAETGYHIEINDVVFEKRMALDSLLAITVRLDYSLAVTPKFIDALLSMYRQRPKTVPRT